MAEICFNLPNSLADALSELSIKEDCTLDVLLTEAVVKHFNLSIDGLVDTDALKHPYYVYVYLNPLVPGDFQYNGYTFDYMPIYVGKGYGDRVVSHLTNAKNDELANVINILKEQNKEPIIIKVKESITSHEAYDIESKLIYLIGRADLQTGPLLNKSSGIHYNSNVVKSTILEDNSQLLILSALNKYSTISEASQHLGISERTIYRRLKTTNIKKVGKKYIIM